MKNSILILVFSLLSISLFSQKEVFFNNLSMDSIKVKSMHGVEVRFSILPQVWAWGLFSFPERFSSGFYTGYFNEKRIGNTWTLNSSIGLHNVIFKDIIWQKDSSGRVWGSYNNMKTNCAFKIEAGIEYRWYFGYKQRCQTGEARLNNGFYLSFPLLFQTTILNTPEPLLNQGWFPRYFNGCLIISPTLGYRQSISKRLFLESNIGIGSSLYISSYNNFETGPPNLHPYFNIKAAYIFNK